MGELLVVEGALSHPYQLDIDLKGKRMMYVRSVMSYPGLEGQVLAVQGVKLGKEG